MPSLANFCTCHFSHFLFLLLWCLVAAKYGSAAKVKVKPVKKAIIIASTRKRIKAFLVTSMSTKKPIATHTQKYFYWSTVYFEPTHFSVIISKKRPPIFVTKLIMMISSGLFSSFFTPTPKIQWNVSRELELVTEESSQLPSRVKVRLLLLYCYKLVDS